MKVYAFDFGAPEACVIKVSSSFQFARTVISPTNIIQFQRNKDILIDIDTCINLKSSKRYSVRSQIIFSSVFCLGVQVYTRSQFCRVYRFARGKEVLSNNLPWKAETRGLSFTFHLELRSSICSQISSLCMLRRYAVAVKSRLKADIFVTHVSTNPRGFNGKQLFIFNG